MNIENLTNLLESVKSGKTEVTEAIEQLRKLPFEDVGFAKIDHHRTLRQGFPEVIFCRKKTVTQVSKIAERILDKGSNLLATLAEPEIFEAIRLVDSRARYNELGRTVTVVQSKIEEKDGIVVVSAGTSDIPVAEEAVETAQIMGNNVERLYDVGVSGLHRLLGNQDKLIKANVIIVVAGMEGALPSVIGGLVSVPVIAVPTSVGYGANFGGLAPLLTMLNSCASGVTVVNIDNGFGAGYSAALMNRMFFKQKIPD